MDGKNLINYINYYWDEVSIIKIKFGFKFYYIRTAIKYYNRDLFVLSIYIIVFFYFLRDLTYYSVLAW